MHHKVILFIAGVVVLAGLGLSPVDAAQPKKTMRIMLPATVEPEKVTIVVGKYGKGLAVSELSTKKGLHEYDDDVSWGRSVKLLVYCPGYKTVTAEFDTDKVSPAKPFIPVLKPVPMVPLTVRLTDTAGNPLVGRHLELRLGLRSHQYYGYFDGISYGATVARGKTDKKGEISVEVPSLLDDPYFTDDHFVGFGVEMIEDRRQGDWPHVFLPAGIPAQRRYGKPFAVKWTGMARVRGSLSRAYLKKHDIDPKLLDASDDRLKVSFDALTSKGGQGRMIGKSGIFEMYLNPGTYDLVVESHAKPRKRIVVHKGAVLSEKEDRVINLE